MKLVFLGLIAILVVGFTMFSVIKPNALPAFSKNSSNKIESTHLSPIRTAKEVYKDKKEKNVDMSKSPCLSDDMGNGYALDVSHNPKIAIDDQNKCETYQSGQVKHIVEISPDGKINRIN
ncbi:MAG: hypothetical protein M3P33_02520 [bacterium]|nr:hypothetical protein [bacterium]